MTWQSQPFSSTDASALRAALPEFLPGASFRHSHTFSDSTKLSKIVRDSFTALVAELDQLAASPDMTYGRVHTAMGGFLSKKPLELAAKESSPTLPKRARLGECAVRDCLTLGADIEPLLAKLSSMSLDIKAQLVAHRPPRLDVDWVSVSPERSERDAVVAHAKKISERFNLDGVLFIGMTNESPRALLRYLDSCEKAMVSTCKRLGLQESDWGDGGRVKLGIMSSRLALSTNLSGQISMATDGEKLMRVNPTALNLASVVVHETAHHLDIKLGELAVLASGGPIEKANSSYFSQLPAHIQAKLPAAKIAFDEVLAPLQNGSGTSVRVELDRLADRFAVDALGEQAFATMPASLRKEFVADLRSDDDKLLRGLAVAALSLPLDVAIDRSLGDTAVSTASRPFVSVLQKVHGDRAFDAVVEAVRSNRDQVAAVAAHLHPLAVGGRPSPMLADSVKADLDDLAASNTRAYWSDSRELFARTLERPTSLRETCTAVDSPRLHHPLSASAISKLNDAVGVLIEQASWGRSAGPDLSRGSEMLRTGLAQGYIAATRMFQNIRGLQKEGDPKVAKHHHPS